MSQPFPQHVLGVLLAAVLLTGITACTAPVGDVPPGSVASATPTTTSPPGAGVTETSAGYADLVARLGPSVVTIRTDGGLGSGVVFRPDVVLTNQHVVAGADRVVVEYADGSSSPGRVLATDVVTDLAVVQTERTDLPVPEYRTELPRPGEVVLALGSPLGFEGSVTVGVVSGVNRTIPGSAARNRALVDLIQTDAAIAPGNSGGALLDTAGRVVGINEASVQAPSGAVALGFAIPAGTAVDIAEQLLEDGTATHTYLGVSVGRLTSQIARALDVAVQTGAVVLGVDPEGPAATAGVRRGDVIVGLAGQPVDSVEDLFGVLRDLEPGRQAVLTVVRDGEKQELQVTIGAQSP